MSDKLQLKRYTIQTLIGEGGMADVYLAFDNVLKRPCAIKILKSNLANDVVAKIRFRREADAAAKLQHPNIVMIYDVGESNNRPFIVMEYVNGQTLKDLIVARGAIEKKEAVFLASQVAEALAVAHQAGIIHRDIKPQNIMVKADGTVKITDFGIASMAGNIQLTQHDSVMGSVHYLAPECSKGDPASNQSDLYSLGIVLFEMLTGEVPFKGDSVVSVAMKHLQEDIKSVRSFNKSIEQSIENIIIKATAKKRALRYQNANEMLADLKTAFSLEHANDQPLKLEVASKMADQQTRVFQDLPEQVEANKKGQFVLWVEKYRKPILFGLIGLFVVLLAILAIILNPSKPQNMVPNVTNMSVENATKYLEEKGYLVKVNPMKETSATIDKDKVIRTTPSANSSVKKGQEIILHLSAGKEFIVENYSGKRLEEVQKIFQNVSNVILTVNYEESGKVKEGVVISQEGVVIGTILDPNNSYQIQLTVSKPEMIRIPEIINESVDSAKKKLEGLGFKVHVREVDPTNLIDEEFAKISFNTVFESSIPENSLVKLQPDAEITISYYKEISRSIANKEALIKTLNEALAIDLTNKTPATVEVLNVAISNAQSVLDNNKSPQNVIDAAQISLQKAIANLADLPKPVFYTVTFYDGLPSSQEILSLEVAENSKIGQDLPIPEYEGHKLIGWKVQGSDHFVDPLIIPITQNMKFVAQWEKVE